MIQSNWVLKWFLYNLSDFDITNLKWIKWNFRIPKLTFEGGDSDEFAVCEDAFEAIRLDVSRVPLFVTLTRISNQYVIDVSREEEAGSISSVTFAVNQDDGIVYIKKLGVGSLHPDPFKENFKVSLKSL